MVTNALAGGKRSSSPRIRRVGMARCIYATNRRTARGGLSVRQPLTPLLHGCRRRTAVLTDPRQAAAAAALATPTMSCTNTDAGTTLRTAAPTPPGVLTPSGRFHPEVIAGTLYELLKQPVFVILR